MTAEKKEATLAGAEMMGGSVVAISQTPTSKVFQDIGPEMDSRGSDSDNHWCFRRGLLQRSRFWNAPARAPASRRPISRLHLRGDDLFTTFWNKDRSCRDLVFHKMPCTLGLHGRSTLASRDSNFARDRRRSRGRGHSHTAHAAKLAMEKRLDAASAGAALSCKPTSRRSTLGRTCSRAQVRGLDGVTAAAL